MTDAITIQNPRNRGGNTGHVLAKRSVTFTEIRSCWRNRLGNTPLQRPSHGEIDTTSMVIHDPSTSITLKPSNGCCFARSETTGVTYMVTLRPARNLDSELAHPVVLYPCHSRYPFGHPYMEEEAGCSDSPKPFGFIHPRPEIILRP